MTEAAPSASKNKVVLPGQAADASTMSAPEGAGAASVSGTNNAAPPTQSQEDLAKEVTWHDQHGMDLTQVREFEPRCVTPASPSPPPSRTQCQPQAGDATLRNLPPHDQIRALFCRKFFEACQSDKVLCGVDVLVCSLLSLSPSLRAQ